MTTSRRARGREADWARIRRDLDDYGGALIGPLVTPEEAARIASLYTDDTRFRSTVNMAGTASVKANTVTSPNRCPARSSN